MVKSGFLLAAATCVLLLACSNQVLADDQAKCKCENDYKINTNGCCESFLGEYREGGEDCLFPNRDTTVQAGFLGCCQDPSLKVPGNLEDTEHRFGQCGD